MKDLSLCHFASVKEKSKTEGVETIVETTCSKCGKPCDVFHGTEAQAKKYLKESDDQSTSQV